VKRRQLLAAAGVAATAAWWWGGRRDHGQNHSSYFADMAGALDRAQLSRPTLVIDKTRLQSNIDVLTSHLGSDYRYRVVAKSLPSTGLLKDVCRHSGSSSLMVFHQPFLNQVAREMPHCDVLLGKPMPVAAAARFYQQHEVGPFDPSVSLQWLVDTPRRIQQYAELAGQLGTSMRLNLELDVGLHRGGISSDAALVQCLQLIEGSPALELSGFMGYEPHVAKMPGILGGPSNAFERAQQAYRHYLQLAETQLGRSLTELTLNGAGSPTYQMYSGQQVANELSAGSALVKPADFDLDSLSDHQPAAFIATPVLKSLPTSRVPGIEGLAAVDAWLNPNRQQAFFIYGGYWKAIPESPAGLRTNPVYGRSTNQEMLNGSASINLQADDWVFLRPSQSEHVFLQFGDIAIYDSGHITGFWSVFSQGA
jgi:D-serine deaminase-like pyridoxal phosphate-dependent protein